MSKIAVYAGTFDPITNGHLDIILRASRMFEKLYIAVVEQPNKKVLFSAEERVDLVRRSVAAAGKAVDSQIVVSSFSGLLVEYIRTLGCTVVIRGLRAVSDYEYEAQMAIINRHLAEEIETVFLMTSDNCSFISASIVREIAKLGGDVSGLVPPTVNEKLRSVFGSLKVPSEVSK
ncbi:MAG: pantetheine-phosphate adenylyltransferase [Bdellovibrionota bacterium]